MEENKRHLVLMRLAHLNSLELVALRAEWPKYFGGDPAPNYRRKQMLARLAWRVQELYFGGHSDAVLARIHQIAQNDPLCHLGIKRPAPIGVPAKGVLPGTRLVRYWHQERYEVIALDRGFEFQGKVFRSLSAVAEAITGQHWNGRSFFGLNKKAKEAP